MATRQATYPFDIYAFEGNEKTDHLGGANDLPSAVALAAAHYTAKQGSNPLKNWGIGIFDDSAEDEGLVAYVGRHEGD